MEKDSNGSTVIVDYAIKTEPLVVPSSILNSIRKLRSRRGANYCQKILLKKELRRARY